MASKTTVRTYDEECKYLEKISSCAYRIKKGFVDDMKVCTYMFLSDI